MVGVGSKLVIAAALAFFAATTAGCAKSACSKLLPTCDACKDNVTREECTNLVFGEDQSTCQQAMDQNSFPLCQ